jgi:hypothetical protein
MDGGGLWGLLFVTASLSQGSAGGQASPAAATEEVAPPVCSAVAYDASAIETIMEKRDWGDSLAQVSKEVGGTREDVKWAERLEKARRKADRDGGRALAEAAAEEARRCGKDAAPTAAADARDTATIARPGEGTIAPVSLSQQASAQPVSVEPAPLPPLPLPLVPPRR